MQLRFNCNKNGNVKSGKTEIGNTIFVSKTKIFEEIQF